MIELIVAFFIVAHRGASADAPENTVPSFELAWEQKADAIEGDFHLTKDGHIVCIHDYDTLRVAGEKLVVAETTLESLRMLDVGKWKGPEFTGTRIPIIEEVLATVPPDKKIYIEVKIGPEMVSPLTKVLKESKLEPRQIVVISFNDDFLKAWKDKHPTSTTMLLVSFDKRRPQLTPSISEIITRLQASGADGLSSSEHPAVNRTVIENLKDEGFEYHSWTIDETRLALRSLKAGSMSLTTNQPAKLRANLEAELPK